MFFAITINHNTLSNLEKVDQTSLLGNFDLQKGNEKTELLNILKNVVSESFIVSTCNRTLIFFEDALAIQKANNVYETLCNFKGLEGDDFKQYFRKFSGLNAVKHIFDISVGLNSKILGENNITSQLLEDIKDARANGNTAKNINDLRSYISSALLPEVAKTDFRTKGSVSEVHKIATYINSYLPNETNQSFWNVEQHIPDDGFSTGGSLLASEGALSQNPTQERNKLLVIGTGAFAQEQVDKLKNMLPYFKDKPQDIMLYSKTPGRAKELAATMKVGYFEGELIDGLKKASHVIAATTSDQPIIRHDDVQNNIPYSTLRIFDLSMPKACEAKVADLPNVELFTLFDIQESVNNDLLQRYMMKPEIEKIVDKHVRHYGQKQPESKVCMTCIQSPAKTCLNEKIAVNF